ncbi:MAG: hypothetical protein VW378_01730 [bacterium]
MLKIKPLLILTVLIFYLQGIDASLPISKQARITDASSVSEVELQASGLFYSDKKMAWRKRRDVKKNGVAYAINDAKKAAFYYLLYSGTDPLLSNEEEKEKFAGIKEIFFRDETISRWISDSEDIPDKKVLLKRGTGVKVSITLKINREELRKYLELESILEKRQTIFEKIGYPQIMVISRSDMTTSTNQITEGKKQNHAASVIESSLSAKGYDVIVPTQKQFLQQLNQKQFTVSGHSQDMSYELAQSIGCDIYIQVEIAESQSDYNTKKIAATLKAYESSTARLLGAETGYSKARIGEEHVSIEEALLEAINNILNRINTYWKADLEKGLRYKVVVKLEDIQDKKERELVKDQLVDSIEELSVYYKENIVTDKTVSYIIWCNVDQYKSGRNVWRKLREAYQEKAINTEISLLNQNRKLIISSISNVD